MSNIHFITLSSCVLSSHSFPPTPSTRRKHQQIHPPCLMFRVPLHQRNDRELPVDKRARTTRVKSVICPHSIRRRKKKKNQVAYKKREEEEQGREDIHNQTIHKPNPHRYTARRRRAHITTATPSFRETRPGPFVRRRCRDDGHGSERPEKSLGENVRVRGDGWPRV
jgi:hypothetical protein